MSFKPYGISDLIDRLKPLGFGEEFLRAAIFPDWWDDESAEIPYNRALVEMLIARQLGLPLEALRDPSQPLKFPCLVPFRLKSVRQDDSPERCRPSVHVAQRIAQLLVRSCPGLPPFMGQSRTRTSIRQSLLEIAPVVTLESLIQYCWASGIIVAHMDGKRFRQLPSFSKFDGLVVFAKDRPCIFLADPSDIPAWQAFHLAHELGHIFLKHVVPGGELLVDDDIEQVSKDDIETAANDFATFLLTGKRKLSFAQIKYGLRAPQIAEYANRRSLAENIDPATITLMYGRNKSHWAAASLAVKHLKANVGALKVIQQALVQHYQPDELPESDAQLIEYLTMSPAPLE